MDTQAWRMKVAVTLLGVALVVLGGSVSGVARAAGQPPGGPPDQAGPNVVLSGTYVCTNAMYSYLAVPEEPPVTYTELIDSLSMSTTGGLEPAGLAGSGQPRIGPGFGGRGPIVGGAQPVVVPVSGFGTGHSFDGGTIEDCVRFAQTMAQTSSGLGCTTSDVRRRQPPSVPIFTSPSASFSFVCEGPGPVMVHLMGELNRAVLGLQIQPAP